MKSNLKSQFFSDFRRIFYCLPIFGAAVGLVWPRIVFYSGLRLLDGRCEIENKGLLFAVLIFMKRGSFS